MSKGRLDTAAYIKGVLSGDWIMLAKAITLVESDLPADQVAASEVLDAITPSAGNAIRVGITGVPGVGKSTFIEALGNMLTSQKKKVAVLAVDPSSQLTKGSILGDKTRMNELARNPMAYIRPSASANVLGGVAGKTREAMLLCEAAGFDVVIVETIGVGQSEVAVRNMVDFFLLLALAGAGDELQGMKKGIMEMADGVVITKADGGNTTHTSRAQADYRQALHLLPEKSSGWTPKVLTASAVEGKGIAETWEMINAYYQQTNASGFHQSNRKNQNVSRFHEYFLQLMQADHLRFPELEKKTETLSTEIASGTITPYVAARKLLEAYHAAIKNSKNSLS